MLLLKKHKAGVEEGQNEIVPALSHENLKKKYFFSFHSQLTVCLLLVYSVAEAKRVRVRTRPQQEPVESEQLIQESESEEERRPIIQYFAEPRADRDDQRVILVPANSEEDYPEEQQYARPAPRAQLQRAESPRPRANYQTPTTVAPRRRDDTPKEPPVQTIRNYNKVNDDGSFTFGYEAADGSFKEETRGTDCVVRGKYGYVDPDGNKREFTYVSGNPCDPNNPEGNEEEAVDSVENSDENIPQNYPRRPTPPRPQPPRPSPTTTRPPTTVFQNIYNVPQAQSAEEEDENIPQTIQIGRPRPTARQQQQQAPVQVSQRPRVQIVNTTPTPTQFYHSTQPVSITPRPYKPQTNLPATTYKPPIQIVTQKAVTTPAVYSSTRYGNQKQGNVDFDAEFKNFQKNNNAISSSTPAIVTAPKQFKPSPQLNSGTNNPIYESQLIFDPSSGQYDTQLYQQLPQSEGDFSVNHRIQPYVHNPPTAQPQLVNFQQQFQQPQQREPAAQGGLYRHQIQHQAAAAQSQSPQIPQQLYQKQQSELQFLNSQQLFEQQLALQQNQLHRDRLEAAKKSVSPSHRFEVRPSPVRLQQSQAGQQFYYIQPNAGQGGGQIDAFLRGHNVDF